MTNGCIRITGPGDRWQPVSPRGSGAELDTVQLVSEVPEFLGLRAATVAPGSSTGRVLVAVDARGRVQLVACPAKTDDAELSSLVADLLATAGRFWHQPYDTLARAFDAALGGSLVDRLSARAGKEWNVGSFRTGVESSLSQGRFPVVVVVPEYSKPVEAMSSYLRNMNLQVTLLGYGYSASSGVEFVQPVLLEKAVAGAAQPPRPEFREEPTPVVTIARAGPEEPRAGEYPPFTEDKATPKQQELLGLLAGLDDLRLVRRGLEYFLPAFGGEEMTEGSIVLAIDPNRWPFPKPDEVIVVVNTAQEHLAGYLKVRPEEIQEFLGSLPREERKEHKGCMLLRASGVGEALQLVNELKALKEVAFGGIS